MDSVPEFTGNDELGRSILSRKSKRLAQRNRVPLHEFLPGSGESRISMDRVSMADGMEATRIADARAAQRVPTDTEMTTRKFYGWAVILAGAALTKGRQIFASPSEDNPYHADIVLPQHVAADRVLQKEHAQDLADASCWLARPDSNQCGQQGASP